MDKSLTRLLLFAMLSVVVYSVSGWGIRADLELSRPGDLIPADTNDPDSALKYPFNEESGGVYLNDPSNYSEEVEYDTETGNYIVTTKIGKLNGRPPMIMTPEEYQDYIAKKQVADYWQSKTQSAEAAEAEGRDPENSLIPQIQVDSELFNRIFGSNTIDIRPQGYAELSFGGRFQKIDNPIIPERNRNTFVFDFDQRIQMNVAGSIGEKLKITTNYDTEATFSFENQVKVEFTGDEDDIIKKIELGNVSLPLNSSLITGAQSLFGVKGQFQFGKLTLTGVFSEQRSQTSSINIQGGATTTEFEIWGDEYEANRHFFLSQFFRDKYEEWLSNPPQIISPVQVTKVEVWVTNTRQATENVRDIVAFMDLGESERDAYRGDLGNPSGGPNIFPGSGSGRFPDNDNNQLDPAQLQADYPGIREASRASEVLGGAGFEEATEYIDLTNARKLTASEFTFHPQLGYISLATSLNQDEVVAVSYQYTAGGQTFQVGEFSTDGVAPPKALITKMLKSTILNVRLPMWDLMMKNVYSLNAFQVNSEDFRLQVLYQNDETGTPVPFLPDGNLSDQLLLRVMDLDRLNANNDPQPDGFFDFVSSPQIVTINPQNGRIIFPVLEPFGSNLQEKLTDPEAQEKYVFQELYDSTRFVAQNETSKNKYLISGSFKSSSSSEIQLNAFNIPQGSISVTAGGQTLVENVQYTVDYNLGRVRITDEGILNSGLPIKVDFENNALFSFQTRTFMGVDANYKFNDHLNIGGTMVRLSERPLTQKVNIGDEPIANTIIGLNGTYTDEAPYLTKFVDAIPFIDTKERSDITVQGEVARFIPGTPRGIDIGGEATTYLDDFESSQTTIDIRNPLAWKLASTPANQPELFPEGNNNDISYNYNRARLAWYTIDPLFQRDEARTPDNIRNDKDLQADQRVRQVLYEEVFPNYQRDPSQPQNIAMLDLAYYPSERGPYNFDVTGAEGFSEGINAEGALLAPSTRWGGIMRDLTSTNFEEQNIEFIQFWVMNPYYGMSEEERAASSGNLYFNLGSVSEDILKDGKQAVENGIPTDGDLTKLDSTRWGYTPKVRPPVSAFDNDPDVRSAQDVGYDLLDDIAEAGWIPDANTPSYIARLQAAYPGSEALSIAQQDPAGDNFQYYRGSNLDQSNADILERYKRYNNPEGNSNSTTVDGVTAFATNQPDIEDLNGDQTLSKTETYYQYRVPIKQNYTIGEDYVTDVFNTTTPQLINGETKDVQWVQFKVPIFDPDSKVGSIGDYRSIRFIRMFLKDFSAPIVLRFARLELVRGEWRRYQFNLDQTGDPLQEDEDDNTVFEVAAVNIEQNGKREPIPYVLPPGIDRQVLFGTTSAQQQNEQSLSMRVCNLKDGSARAVFKNLDFDMRLYKNLKMFVHAEDGQIGGNLRDNDLRLFIRLGSDYAQNFYEYEIPLEVTTNDGTAGDDANLIWPDANQIDFALDILKEVKLERDRVYSSSGQSVTERYETPRGTAQVAVLGSPNLGNVRTILIGVRNPRKQSVLQTDDDGLAKCAEIWVNELRLTEFDQSGGWAANARVAAKLADFANVSLSGSMSTTGFGSLDQSVSEVQQEDVYTYNFQSSFELGKFFPKDFGLRIPMFISKGEEWHNPRFNPLDPDIEFEESVANIESAQEQEELRKNVQDYTQRRSINFTNVRKERTGNQKGSAKPWSIENFSASYSFNEIYRRNISTVIDKRKDYKGTLNYTYRTNPKAVEPFKKVGFLQSEHLKFIRDFNFYWYPRSFSVIGTLNRSTNVVEMRNVDNFDLELPRTYNNNFTFNRQYTLNWDLSKSLKLDFNARNQARIDELVDTDDTTYTQQEKNDVIWNNLKDFGRTTNYHQTLNVNWQVPIDKLPFMDFANVTARYTGDYDWQVISLNSTAGGAYQRPDSLDFKNIIQNNQQLSLNNTFNLVALYNKVPYFKKVNSSKNQRKAPQRARILRRPGGDAQQSKKEEEEDEEETTLDRILAITTRTLLMVRSVSANFTQNEGTVLPGFKYTPDVMGVTNSQMYAPGWDFVFGAQVDIAERAKRNDWLVLTDDLNQQWSQVSSTNQNYRVTLEPLNDLRIVLTAQKQAASNESAFFRADSTATNSSIDFQNRFVTETFSMSYYSMPSAFEVLRSDNDYFSKVYQDFLDNRIIISERLADQRAATDGTFSKELIDIPDSSAYGYKGYSVTSQQVLMPAFLAAYGGKDPKEVKLGPKRDIPLPNWTINYDGLSKIKFFKKFFSSFTLNHGYRSNYNINGISTNLLLQQAKIDGDSITDLNGDFLPENQITGLTIAEQFAPLLGINAKLNNSITVRLEYKKTRNISLSLANNQLTETKGTEWVIGSGYIIQDVKLKFLKLGAKRTSPVSNLELKADVGIRDNITIIRKILEGIDLPTAGQKVVTVKLSGDYQITKRVTAKLFYDLNLSRFKTSNAYPITTHQFGLSVRLNLGQ